MAETTTPILSVCVTTSSKIKDLPIKNGQLIFLKDRCKIALDFNDKRTFYNQIIELQTEQERLNIVDPIAGQYYFIIGSAVLWTYQNNNWIQITGSPEEFIFIGTEMPEFGSDKKLYVNKNNRNISVWDNEINDYIVVAEKVNAISIETINALF